ncbi:Acetyl-coenzyme A carboxylase carboxyl transferase subunit alpha [Planctomycetes bacterium Pan216]|uniref:Acetyl-coenzyme A carboxylase carboxyl transferase subunit alpha n=1 Tax=Kolteria novifilia TaxID=2527975 RepID=A0A518B4H4_9BACT|nr:Acetyl-coenzyme A carboxylase carboxyl transferase subunit alpha [Planctomycetes bacterium Pan216]
MEKIFQLPFEKPIYDLEAQLADLEAKSVSQFGVSDEVRRMRRELDNMKRKIYGNLTAWQTITVARHPNRPQTSDYIELVCDEFVELHGDKAFGDDRAIVTGFAKIGDYKVMLVGHQKGKTLKERNERLFGCAHPEGYRKAIAKMQLAAKYRVPIICLIDTPGAYPGIGAEERGQSQMIANNLLEMSLLETPIVCCVIGEGGSGGALGIGVGDRICMLQFAYYSVISPEGCSGILWKDGDGSKEKAAEALKLTSNHLSRLGIVDNVVEEPLGGAHRDHRSTAANLKAQLLRYLRELASQSGEQLVQNRYEKFRSMGVFEEGDPADVLANASA